MDNVQHTSPAPSMWRRAGLAGLAAVAALAVGPIALSVMAPVTVKAQQQSLDGCDFITSGGFVVGPTGKKANFGAHGGCKNGDYWGELNFVDHANGYHVQSVQITGYVMAPEGIQNARDVCGVAQTSDPNDPDTVTFVVRLIDNGEPGGGDQFGMKLSNGYAVPLLNLGTARPGGNVQLHRANNSTTQWPTVTYGVCAFNFGGGPE
ncbi:MAG: post-COAP-1 domain-containing protein [Vicinamibacterales bacterium]